MILSKEELAARRAALLAELAGDDEDNLDEITGFPAGLDPSAATVILPKQRVPDSQRPKRRSAEPWKPKGGGGDR